jgi:hypothetical protein
MPCCSGKQQCIWPPGQTRLGWLIAGDTDIAKHHLHPAYVLCAEYLKQPLDLIPQILAMTDKEQQCKLAKHVLGFWVLLTEVAFHQKAFCEPWPILAVDQVWQLIKLAPMMASDFALPSFSEAMTRSLGTVLLFWVPNLYRSEHADLQLWLAHNPDRMLAL